MFTQLRTRLTVLYAALFGAVMLVVSVAVFTAMTGAVQRQVRGELAATGAVFDRLWSLRSERLREGAALLSRDFGFREAVATGDAATIASAVDNLRLRMGVDQAFLIDPDGRAVGSKISPAEGRALAAAFDAAEDPSGVFMLQDQPYQLVGAPVLAPELIGWVVFAVKLDRMELASLEKMAAIPLQAAVVHREPQHDWTDHQISRPNDLKSLRGFIAKSLTQGGDQPAMLDLSDGRAVAVVKPLLTLDPNGAAVLLLRYPMALALAPYRTLLLVLGLIGLGGLLLVGVGSWFLARGITRPISALDEAAHRLQRGEDAHVSIETADEIGRLADSFNTMATEIRDRERKITHLALHDGDTGLPNRLALERVAEALADRTAGHVYMAAAGIERFNDVRGAIGYTLAAQAVRLIGNRLAGLAPSSGVGRIATDVLGFAIVADGPEAAAEVAARVLDQLEHPIRIGEETIDVAVSIGLAPLHGGQADVPATAIERASIALDQARSGRRKIGFFDAGAYGDPASNLSLMSSMLRAIETGELVLHHQPKFDMRKHRISGVEALVRWNHPTRGMLRPDLFIPMAEETGHIRALTEWVLRRAIADQKTLAAAGHRVSIAVNISGRTLGDEDFADFAEAVVKDAAGPIVFEITETAVIENPELALAMLDRFAEAGIAISIDDFGTGLSSLAYLKQIRGQELKLDRSLVQDITTSKRDALIVRSVIDLAHRLGFKVTAEGIETNASYSLLASMGCDQAQGYLIARPQSLGDLINYLAEDTQAWRRPA
jgi:EAL domain-containing protein (putative c-di-GMP-specific phosphodiesterase class I)/GGDEF domain-containing protein